MALEERLLTTSDGPAFAVENARGSSPVVLVCEHASNAIPARLGGLGLDAEVLASHAAYDIGALETARRMSAHLDAPLVRQRFSRLVYDCNRPPEAPDAMPVRSEVFEIAANAGLGAAERAARTEEIYRPFHAAVAETIESHVARGLSPVLVTVHSFTRVYCGKRRDVDFGILEDRDTRLSDRLLSACESWEDCAVRRNEPYGAGDGVTHTLRLHAVPRGLMNVMFEIANDLVTDGAGQEAWARRLSDLLREAAGDDARQMPQPGSRTA